jgi:hypothetical protein
MNSNVQVERRKHKRFQVQDIAFAVLRGQADQLGQIIDISRGGLAFHFIASGKNVKSSFEMDILLAYYGLYMEKIKFKTISDFQIPNKSPFSPIIMRRHGVKFGELAPNQVSMLEDFIREYTIDRWDANHFVDSESKMASVNNL